MAEAEPVSRLRPARRIFFERAEFDTILALYGRGLAAGEWRDYAIDSTASVVTFAIFRRASEQPMYRIEKQPALQTRQGQWSVTGAGGLILRRGRDLRPVLEVLERKLVRLVARE
jgi:hypothetical protein